MSDHHVTGRCLCGAVTYEATSEHDAIGICHCTDCLRWMGGPFHGVDCKTLKTDGPVLWYRSSDHAERGSCSKCGTALFWKMIDGSHPTVTAGSLDAPEAMNGIKSHIFIDQKPGYYDFKGDAPRLTGEEVIALFMEQMKAEDA
ncbi:GFA family protein [Parvularcula sp. ZS-1/3]|uniref:GFA family protein n=1 Tax=Parvularcula mediterranea TaxID=2732508 RepID=A0A7Y3W3Q6_9PROT|nr:GFA family protein [Parvularcula mediterranea]NNU14708.1 GFA family protein [Parvularcula mediterranea]